METGRSQRGDPLTELRETATWLTPYSVVQENDEWRSEAKRHYTNPVGKLGATKVVIKKTSVDMASVIGFQGEAAGRIGSESRDSHQHNQNFQDHLVNKDCTFFRKRDAFSEYAEAKARNPQLSQT